MSGAPKTFDGFLNAAAEDCVNARSRSAPTPAEQPCPDCEGTGVILTRVPVDKRETKWAERYEPCMGCLGTKTAEACAPGVARELAELYGKLAAMAREHGWREGMRGHAEKMAEHYRILGERKG
ncbi:MAG: hypothetical protein PHS14_12985 [Elusimicrobia bacterium]|nr:hypothetical protein [Elusimicrobiota bacterium]